MAHNNLTSGEIHRIHDAVYATKEALLAATQASADVGKIYLISDSDEYWICKTAGSPGTFLVAGDEEAAKTSTTDDTATNLYSFTMSDNSAIWLESTVVAMETDGSQRAVYKIGGLFYRDGGNATQQGSTVEMITAIESEDWTCAFNISTNDVRVQGTGVAATNITWISKTKIIHVI
jgi:hypothetical protein